jgi:hypothetical protein
MALLPKRFDSGLTPAEAFRSWVITVIAGLALGLVVSRIEQFFIWPSAVVSRLLALALILGYFEPAANYPGLGAGYSRRTRPRPMTAANIFIRSL